MQEMWRQNAHYRLHYSETCPALDMGSETIRILKHMGEQTVRDLPLRPNNASEGDVETWLRVFITPIEASIGDPKYAN